MKRMWSRSQFDNGRTGVIDGTELQSMESTRGITVCLVRPCRNHRSLVPCGILCFRSERLDGNLESDRQGTGIDVWQCRMWHRRSATLWLPVDGESSVQRKPFWGNASLTRLPPLCWETRAISRRPRYEFYPDNYMYNNCTTTTDHSSDHTLSVDAYIVRLTARRNGSPHPSRHCRLRSAARCGRQ